MKTFFRTLDDAAATFRLVETDRDVTFDRIAVARARTRMDETEIHEDNATDVLGTLIGITPLGGRFELRLLETDEIIRGRVDTKASSQALQLIDHGGLPILGLPPWKVRMRIREVRERNRPPKRYYFLVGLLERQTP